MRGPTYLGSAWHGWFHVVGNTYGTWVRGDPRGFRTRHHREHCEGDYRHPPPHGIHDALRIRSERAMKRAPVLLSRDARILACRTFAVALLHHQVELIELAVTGKHFHLVARFPCTPQWIALVSGDEAHGLQSVGFDRFDRKRRRSALDDPPRHYTGIAKKESARALQAAGRVAAGGAWGKRCDTIPMTDRAHQLNAVRYVRAHRAAGATVWSDLEGVPSACVRA